RITTWTIMKPMLPANPEIMSLSRSPNERCCKKSCSTCMIAWIFDRATLGTFVSLAGLFFFMFQVLRKKLTRPGKGAFGLCPIPSTVPSIANAKPIGKRVAWRELVPYQFADRCNRLQGDHHGKRTQTILGCRRRLGRRCLGAIVILAWWRQTEVWPRRRQRQKESKRQRRGGSLRARGFDARARGTQPHPPDLRRRSQAAALQ